MKIKMYYNKNALIPDGIYFSYEVESLVEFRARFILTFLSYYTVQRGGHHAYFEMNQRTFGLVIDGFRFYRKDTFKDRIYWNCIRSRSHK